MLTAFGGDGASKARSESEIDEIACRGRTLDLSISEETGNRTKEAESEIYGRDPSGPDTSRRARALRKRGEKRERGGERGSGWVVIAFATEARHEGEEISVSSPP